MGLLQTAASALPSTAPSPLIVELWCALYAVLFVIMFRYLRKQGDLSLDVFVFVSSAITTGVLPDVLSRIIDPTGSPGGGCSGEREEVIYLAMTLVSCGLLFVWGLGLGYTAMGTGSVLHPLARLATLFYPAVGLGTIAVALGWQQWFVGYGAFQKRIILSFVWPAVIAAPISWARIVLAIATFTIPFVRGAITPRQSPTSGAIAGSQPGEVSRA